MQKRRTVYTAKICAIWFNIGHIIVATWPYQNSLHFVTGLEEVVIEALILRLNHAVHHSVVSKPWMHSKWRRLESGIRIFIQPCRESCSSRLYRAAQVMLQSKRLRLFEDLLKRLVRTQFLHLLLQQPNRLICTSHGQFWTLQFSCKRFTRLKYCQGNVQADNSLKFQKCFR